MHQLCVTIVVMITCLSSFGQAFKLTGRVVNNKLEPLPLVSVKIKGYPYGSVTKEDGSYKVELEAGKYDIAFTMVGFKPQLITIVLNKNLMQNIILEEEDKSLDEAVVRTKLRDRSVEIIKNVIRHKEEILQAPGDYSLSAYIKAVQEDSFLFKKKNKPNPPDSLINKMNNNSFYSMALAELVIRYDRDRQKREKEERLAVKTNGNSFSLFYLSLTEADFNLYNNLLYSRTISPVPFISPLSYSGIAAYRYKLLSTELSGNQKIYTIAFRPREMSNVTMEGELKILDSAWVVLQSAFKLPAYHLPEYDFFEVKQQYRFIENKAWMITRQEFNYFTRHGKGKLSGHTSVNYSGFELNKKFPAKYFGVELSVTTVEAYKKDSLFWQTTRTEPLEEKEIRFIRYSDSMYRVTHAKPYLDSIDRLRNKITWKKLLFDGQSFYNREKQRTWYVPSIPSIYDPFQFGGGRIKLSANYNKGYTSRKYVSVWADASYGIRNHDLNGNIRVTKMYDPFTRAFYRVEAGRNFSYIFSGDAWINMLRRKNLYLKNSFGIGHGKEIINGLFLNTDIDFAERRSLAGYKTGSTIDSLFGGILDDNIAIAFPTYNALYGKIRVSYTPAQRYIREPLEKIILGSKWPTVYIEWKKGIKGPFNSKIDFDYLEFGIEQEIKAGTTGVGKYTLLTGSFINKNDLRLVDYKFQRRGDPLLFMNPHEAFQSLDSTFPLFKRFYQAHYVHEFNGALINRIPFLKELKLKEVAGGGFLIAPERDLRYAEFFAGLEKAFKWPFDKLQKFKIGIYIVASAANRLNNPLQPKIGITNWDRSRDRWY